MHLTRPEGTVGSRPTAPGDELQIQAGVLVKGTELRIKRGNLRTWRKLCVQHKNPVEPEDLRQSSSRPAHGWTTGSETSQFEAHNQLLFQQDISFCVHKGLLLPHRTTRTLQAEQSETQRPHSCKHLMDVCSEQTKQRVKNEHEMTTEWQFLLHLPCFSSPPSSGCCLLSSWGPLIWIPIILLLPRLQQHLQAPAGVNSLSAELGPFRAAACLHT